MRHLALIIAATLAVAACSRPEEDNNVIRIDDDLGGEPTTDMVVELPVLDGEFVAPPTRDNVDDVRISDGGEFLFIVQDDQWFAWLAKNQAVAIDFASWPDTTRPDDGPPSKDVAFDDTYLWFLSEYDGGWSLAGVEHFLGNPSPLFGQPIIIIDLGPIQKPRGIERYGARFLIPTDPRIAGGVGDLISVGENIPPTSTELPGAPLFDDFDGWLGSRDGDRFVISRYDDTEETFTQEWESDIEPIAFAVGDDPYVIRGDGGIWDESDGGVQVGDSPAEDPLIDASGGVVAWTATDGIRVYDGELRRIDAAEVDAIVVDDAHIWWSNSEGVFRAPIP